MLELHLTPDDNLSDILNNLHEQATIYLKSGTYVQKTLISADDLTIIGENRGTTVITYDDYARKIHADGREYNTFRTYTVCVTGERVKLKNLTVENSNTDPSSVGQCVALSVNAKNFYAENVDLKSTQDTLFCSPFPDDLVVRYRGFIPERELYMDGTALQIFRNCRISGTVDFIFGCAEAYFDGCELISLPESRGTGFITAPAHSLKQERGFTFINCNLVSGGAGENSVFLARPWRDFGKCEFINCHLGNHIKAELYDKWNDTSRDQTARFSHFKLRGQCIPSPVKWSRELTASEANKIINSFAERIKQINTN